MHESLKPFIPAIGEWFAATLGAPTPAQVLGWPLIAGGKSGLIVAPTGSGKTLAAFLAAIDSVARRLQETDEPPMGGVQILYLSPLKALANDVQKNLTLPLEQITAVAARRGESWPEVRTAVRTGDTPAKDRAAMLKKPPHILITTPESLNLMLMSAARGMLAGVRFVIVDEVHALAGAKRGVFLSLLLERLEALRSGQRVGKKGMKIAPGVYVPVPSVGELVRVGLSATVRPVETVALWLAGYDDQGRPRPIKIIETGQRKQLDLQVICPFGGAGGDIDHEPEIAGPENPQPRHPLAASRNPPPKDDEPKGTGHWPEVTHAVLNMIRTHRSTLVFTNARRLVERLADRLTEMEAEQRDAVTEPGASERGKPLVILPHHGSISREARLETEQALKRGEVDAVLATSSLELGIDIGTLDLVVQIDSPGNVAAGLQRVGRAGHLEKATAKGRFVARGLYELPSFAALVPLMIAGQVEETHPPENCLDVLAQQIVAACATGPWKRRELFKLFHRAAPYARLAEKQFDAVVAMLSKKTERVTAPGLRPRIRFDRVNDELVILPGAAQVVMMNGGVISDTGQFPVYLIGTSRSSANKQKPLQRRRNAALGTLRPPLQTHLSKRHESAANFGIRIGELDEEFVYETKEGDRIVLGSQTWRVVRIDADRVLVEPADPGSSRMPFWRGESAPRSEMLGEAVARFNGEMVQRLKVTNDAPITQWLTREHHLEPRAAANAIAFYRRQLARGHWPLINAQGEGTIIIEHFTDRTGEPIVAILCPLGSRVNYCLRLALEHQFARRRLPAQVVHHDEGLIIRPPTEAGSGVMPENPLAWLKSKNLEGEIIDQLESTALFGLRFRQNAARALMLPKMNLTQRTPLWQQRFRARHLLALVEQRRFSQS